jgi:hypothetical protein
MHWRLSSPASMPQSEVSGATSFDERLLVLLADGAGHGPDAHQAATRAIEIFREQRHGSLPVRHGHVAGPPRAPL